MSFVNPVLAGVVAAVVIPLLLVLYFLKLRRRRVEIGSTLLWKKTIEDLQANAPFQRLRRNILLLLQLLALLAALLALAQPVLDSELGSAAGRHIILLDRSASMNATDVEAGTRLDEAKRRAIALIESLRGEAVVPLLSSGDADEAMLIVFDSSAEVRERFTSDKQRLIRAIEAVQPSDAPGRLVDAFTLAEAHAPKRVYIDDRTGEAHELEGLSGGAAATVHLFSDGSLVDAADAKPRTGDDLRFERIGSEEAQNVAITALRAERGFSDPAEVRVFVGLQSTSSEPTPVDVELLIDGEVAAVKGTVIQPAADSTPNQASDQSAGQRDPGSGGVLFSFRRTEPALLGIKIDPPSSDALLADNAGAIDLPPARSARVALVTEGNLFLRTALDGLPLERLVEFTPQQYAEQNRGGWLSGFDLVVLDGVLPADRRLAGGQYLVLGEAPSPLAYEADDTGAAREGPAVILDWERDHRALRDLDLSGLLVGSMPSVFLPEDASEDAAVRVLARSDAGPAVLELTGPGMRSIVVPFAPAESNWPFDVSFVVFVAAASLDLVDPAGSGEALAGLSPGEVLTDRVPVEATDVRVVLPSGEEFAPAPSADGRIAFGPVRLAGLYEVRYRIDGQPRVNRRPANLLDPQESDVRSQPTVETASAVLGAEQEAQRPPRPLWTPLLLLALVIVLLEWYVYNRKVSL